jgi:hypothetical protein
MTGQRNQQIESSTVQRKRRWKIELTTKLKSLQTELDTLREGRAGIAIISYFSYVSPMVLINPTVQA